MASMRKPRLQDELCCSRNVMYRNLVTACNSFSSLVGALGSTFTICIKLKKKTRFVAVSIDFGWMGYWVALADINIIWCEQLNAFLIWNDANRTFWYKSGRAVELVTSDSRNVRVPILMSMTLGSVKPCSKSCISMKPAQNINQKLHSRLSQHGFFFNCCWLRLFGRTVISSGMWKHWQHKIASDVPPDARKVWEVEKEKKKRSQKLLSPW